MLRLLWTKAGPNKNTDPLKRVAILSLEHSQRETRPEQDANCSLFVPPFQFVHGLAACCQVVDVLCGTKEDEERREGSDCWFRCTALLAGQYNNK